MVLCIFSALSSAKLLTLCKSTIQSRSKFAQMLKVEGSKYKYLKCKENELEHVKALQA